MLHNIALNSSAEQKTALAESLVSANLAEKGKDLQDRQSRSFRFENGDKVTIEAGFAQPLSYTDGEGTERKYLGFPASVKHANGSVEETTISLRQLTSPTILLEEKTTCKRADLRYRFGRQQMAFEDVTVDGQAVTLAKLANRLTLTITTGSAWMPDYDSYNETTREYDVLPEPRENYGYVA